MFCTACGAKNSDDAIFCQKCGKQLQLTNQDEQLVVSTPQSVSNRPAQDQTNNNRVWTMVLGIIVLILVLGGGAYFWSQYNSATFYNQTSNNTSSNSSTAGNSSQNADPSQIPGVIQQFCNDVMNKDYQSAWGLLSQNEQYQEKDINGLSQGLAYDFDSNYQQQHGYMSGGGFSNGTYTVTGCTTSGDPLITQGSGSIPTTAQQHFAWTFSDNTQTPGQIFLVFENGSWKINSFNVDLT